jgi:hypothetical protein
LIDRPSDSRTLYATLGEPAPPGSIAGETRITRQKETIDADREAFDFEEPIRDA